jgi:hypothetical protein
MAPTGRSGGSVAPPCPEPDCSRARRAAQNATTRFSASGERPSEGRPRRRRGGGIGEMALLTHPGPGIKIPSRSPGTGGPLHVLDK